LCVPCSTHLASFAVASGALAALAQRSGLGILPASRWPVNDDIDDGRWSLLPVDVKLLATFVSFTREFVVFA
jgi:hypothetical protein